MLKKFTWIVALLAALTIVIGCTNAGIDPEWDDPDKDFKKFNLVTTDDDGEAVIFNTKAGNPKQQQGWATDGYIDDENDEVVASAFKISDFTGARFLVIETANNPRGGLDIVWQSKNFPATGWLTQKYAALASNSNANPGTTKKTGNAYGGATIRIDLPIVFGPTYGNYLAAADFLRIILAYYSPDLDDLDVKEAYLLISDKKSPISPELDGLSATSGLKQTTIRKSADEYGWQFAEKVGTPTPKLPAGTIDIDTLRDAEWLLLVTKGGGTGINGGLGGWNKPLTITFEFNSTKIKTTAATQTVAEKKEKIDSKSVEKNLYGDSFAYEHTDSEEVYFLIDLSTLGISGNLTATVGGDGTNKNDEAYDKVDITLNHAPLEQFGIIKAYLLDDEDDDLNKTNADALSKTVDLKGTFLGQAVGPFGYVTNDSDLVFAFLYVTPGVELIGDAVNGSDVTYTVPDPQWTAPARGHGGWACIKPTTAAFAALDAATPGSFLRFTIQNSAGGAAGPLGDRGGWGSAELGVGKENMNGVSGATGTRDIEVSIVKGKGWDPVNGFIFNFFNDQAATSILLYVAK